MTEGQEDDLYAQYKQPCARAERTPAPFIFVVLICVATALTLFLGMEALLLNGYLYLTGGREFADELAFICLLPLPLLVYFGEEIFDVTCRFVEMVYSGSVAIVAAVFVTPFLMRRILRATHAGRLELGALDPDTTAILSKHTGGTFRRTWGLRRFLDGGYLRHADLLHILELERNDQECLAAVYRARGRAETAYVDHLVADMDASADAVIAAFHACAAALAREAADASTPQQPPEKHHGKR